MGLFNATDTKPETVARDYAPVLIEGERVLIAFKTVRDLVFLTNLRLCTVNVQGLTGRKVEIESIPYKSIVRWSIERAGTFDMDADLVVWVSGSDVPIEVKVSAGANIVGVQQVLARHILGGRAVAASKLLERMRGNPNDWRIDDVIAICQTYGIACTPPRNGSHYKVKHPSQPEILTIPARRPIKPVYVRALIRFVDQVNGERA